MAKHCVFCSNDKLEELTPKETPAWSGFICKSPIECKTRHYIKIQTLVHHVLF